MIYEKISFRAAPFSYNLVLRDRITLVRGDSATGKTYLYQMLEDLKMTKTYQAIKLFNYKTDDFHANLKNCREKFIVIDNADLLLDDEDRQFINFEVSNQYLLFARKLTENDQWTIKGKCMGACWYQDCCVAQNTRKTKCGISAKLTGENKIRELMIDAETKRIVRDIEANIKE